MNTYPLSIVTPNGQVFADQVTSLIAPGIAGFLGVLAGHAPCVVFLKKGPLTIKKKDVERFYAIGPGVLEVDGPSHVIILCGYAAQQHSFEEAKRHAMSLNL